MATTSPSRTKRRLTHPDRLYAVLWAALLLATDAVCIYLIVRP